jgi:hypothetical protein
MQKNQKNQVVHLTQLTVMSTVKSIQLAMMEGACTKMMKPFFERLAEMTKAMEVKPMNIEGPEVP